MSQPVQDSLQIILDPIGLTFANGLSSSYECMYPNELFKYRLVEPRKITVKKDSVTLEDMTDSIITREEFHSAITRINENLIDLWPCVAIQTLSWCCCIMSCSLSLFCSQGQYDEAESSAHFHIKRINNQENFESLGIKWELKRSGCRCPRRKSWIIITIPMKNIIAVNEPPSENTPRINTISI